MTMSNGDTGKAPGRRPLLQSNSDALISIDTECRIYHMNPLAELLTGWPRDEAQGQPLTRVFDLLDERSGEPAIELVTQCLAKGQVAATIGRTLLRDRSGNSIPIRVSVVPHMHPDGDITGAAIVFKDISRERRLAQKMRHHATHDALTGLVNRLEFERRLHNALKGNQEHGGRYILGCLDLDQFKIVNDTVGHAAGDRLLKQISYRLLEQLRDRDTLARLGGDEFALLLDNCPLEQAVQIVRKLISSISEFQFSVGERSFRIGACVGLAEVDADKAETAAQLLAQADNACYQAKRKGQNQVAIYRGNGAGQPRRCLPVNHAQELREAIEHNRFRLGLQPVISLGEGHTTPIYYEFLLRLRNPGGEILPPAAFLPTAERCGLITAIDRWVIQTAFRGISGKGGDARGQCYAINISKQSLSDDSLPGFIKEQLIGFSLSANQICFEINEAAAMSDLYRTAGFITQLKAEGFRFTLDGLGEGLLPFHCLKKLPVDYLKIFGGLVCNMTDDPVSFAMIESINNIGHRLGIRTIAGQVENDLTLRSLKRLGIDYAQGFGIEEPTLKQTCSADCGAGLAG